VRAAAVPVGANRFVSVLGHRGDVDSVPGVEWGCGYITTRWQMTWRERLSALFFGRVWITVDTVREANTLALSAVVSDDFKVPQ